MRTRVGCVCTLSAHDDRIGVLQQPGHTHERELNVALL